MGIFLLKLVFTPALIAIATLISRRYGARVAGVYSGLPLTSGPVSVFFLLEQGPDFTAQAAKSTLLGVVSVATFCCVYGLLARARSWQLSLVAGLGALAIATFLLKFLTLGLLAVVAVVLATLAGAQQLLKLKGPAPPAPVAPPWWDIPLRMLIATTLVVVLTAAAHRLGPTLIGLLSPFPVFAAVLGTFTHQREGNVRAVLLLRGIIMGSFSFAAFFFIVGALVTRMHAPVAYGIAGVAALLVNAGLLFGGAEHPPVEE